MKECPTSNMNKSRLWGFEVSHIIASFGVLTTSNVLLSITGQPVVLSWAFGILSLMTFRVLSHGEKAGHLELKARFMSSPHIYLGHKSRSDRRETR